nr:hypothetical protein [Kibdelosporangium sp. MJ126-NF4]
MLDMVARQVPKVFAVVIASGHLDDDDAHVVAWGMTLDDGAYMTTVDGRNQFLLAEPENALRYIRHLPESRSYLVWAA